MGQRAIYDERYAGDGYDGRSAVPVLTAEKDVLHHATGRILTWLPASDPVTLLDFASGTGRVSNGFAFSFPRSFAGRHSGMHMVAYDVSAVGLDKAARCLVEDFGFDVTDAMRFDRHAEHGYTAGSVRRISEATTVEVTFVHGNEDEPADRVGELLLAANGGRRFTMTTSWYSGLAHIPTAERRGSFFRMLNAVTDQRGEVLIGSSVTGDLVELQQEWTQRLLRGDVGDWPIERQGDLVYETELSQENFYHVFSVDLAELLELNRAAGQRTWLEAVRMPGPEFTSVQEEAENHRRVKAFNDRIRRRAWSPDDYRQVHTAVAIRSGQPSAAGASPRGVATPPTAAAGPGSMPSSRTAAGTRGLTSRGYPGLP